jgi:hypothetical protein
LNPFKSKSRFAKVVDSLESNERLRSAAIMAAESALAGATSQRQADRLAKALRALELDGHSKKGLFKGKGKTALFVGAGTAAAVAASASISSMRRREDNSE